MFGCSKSPVTAASARNFVRVCGSFAPAGLSILTALSAASCGGNKEEAQSGYNQQGYPQQQPQQYPQQQPQQYPQQQPQQYPQQQPQQYPQQQPQQSSTGNASNGRAGGWRFCTTR